MNVSIQRLKAINFYIQSGLCSLADLLGLLMILQFEVFVVFGVLELFVGGLQYLLSLTFSLFNTFRTSLGLIHLGLSTALIIVLFIEPDILGPGVFVFPWLLAILFWITSYKLFSDSKILDS